MKAPIAGRTQPGRCGNRRCNGWREVITALVNAVGQQPDRIVTGFHEVTSPHNIEVFIDARQIFRRPIAAKESHVGPRVDQGLEHADLGPRWHTVQTYLELSLIHL